MEKKKKGMKTWKKLALILIVLGAMGFIPQTRKIVFLILPIGSGTLDTIATLLFVVFLIIVFFNIVAKYTLRLLAWFLTAIENSVDETKETGEFDMLDKIKKLQKRFE